MNSSARAGTQHGLWCCTPEKHEAIESGVTTTVGPTVGPGRAGATKALSDYTRNHRSTYRRGDDQPWWVR